MRASLLVVASCLSIFVVTLYLSIPAPVAADAKKVSKVKDAKAIKIDITAPENGTKLTEEVAMIIGKVSDPSVKVWVVVKPNHVSDCWVQPAAAVGKDGIWRVSAKFGEHGTHDEDFDIMAIALQPQDATIRKGKIECWPDVAAKSTVIHVHRE